MRLNDKKHPHLTSLLATYEQLDRFYLILPCAEVNLEQYWKTLEHMPTVDHATVLWMAVQCIGLAEGLAQIHKQEMPPKWLKSGLPTRFSTIENDQMIGRHGDINPCNILRFKDPEDDTDRGTLKIADFGLVKFDNVHSASITSKTTTPVSPTYRPPEYDLNGATGRPHDVWALGCVYLDFVTWLLGGWEMVEDFSKSRLTSDPEWQDIQTDTYFQIVDSNGSKEAVVKPAVGTVRPQVQHQRILISHSI